MANIRDLEVEEEAAAEILETLTRKLRDAKTRVKELETEWQKANMDYGKARARRIIASDTEFPLRRPND